MRTLLLAGVAMIGWWRPADAAYIVTLTEVGGDVVASGSGSIDTASLSLFPKKYPTYAGIIPNDAAIATGVAYPGASAIQIYDITASSPFPTSFGPGGKRLPASATASTLRSATSIRRPRSFSCRTSICPTLLCPLRRRSGAIFASFGLTVGSYVFSFGNDSFTVAVGASPAIPVPEPATLALLALPLGAAGLVKARQRTSSAT